jgi:hypothetical protein
MCGTSLQLLNLALKHVTVLLQLRRLGASIELGLLQAAPQIGDGRIDERLCLNSFVKAALKLQPVIFRYFCLRL